MKTTWASVSSYLLGFSHLYPAISAWSPKVRDGVISGNRSVVAVISPGARLTGLAIIRNGRHAKLCHISISDFARASGFGLSLMRAATYETLKAGATRVHVTTGEEVACAYGEFFQRVGFAYHNMRVSRYRQGIDELEWVAGRDSLVRSLGQFSMPVPSSKSLSETSSTMARLRWVSYRRCFEWAPMTIGGHPTHYTP